MRKLGAKGEVRQADDLMHHACYSGSEKRSLAWVFEEVICLIKSETSSCRMLHS
jgi:hypothetical protein